MAFLLADAAQYQIRRLRRFAGSHAAESFQDREYACVIKAYATFGQ
jgi:hypothetical protein